MCFEASPEKALRIVRFVVCLEASREKEPIFLLLVVFVEVSPEKALGIVRFVV